MSLDPGDLNERISMSLERNALVHISSGDLKCIMSYYREVEKDVLEIMLKWHVQYYIPSDNVDYIARIRSERKKLLL